MNEVLAPQTKGLTPVRKSPTPVQPRRSTGINRGVLPDYFGLSRDSLIFSCALSSSALSSSGHGRLCDNIKILYSRQFVTVWTPCSGTSHPLTHKCTVKPPNNGTPRSDQTLYNGHTEWNGMFFLQLYSNPRVTADSQLRPAAKIFAPELQDQYIISSN